MRYFIICLIIIFIELVFVFKKHLYLFYQTNLYAKQQMYSLINLRYLLLNYIYQKRLIVVSPCLGR